MITEEYRRDAYDNLFQNWTAEAPDIMNEVRHSQQFDGTLSEFLKHCTACGGNWGGMLLTGVQELYPRIYELIPDDMGVFPFSTICSLLVLLGVDCS